MMTKNHNVTAKPPFYWVRVLWLTNKKNHWKHVNRSWTKCQGNRYASCIVWNQNLLDTGKFVRRSSLSTQWKRFPDLFEGSELRVKDKKYLLRGQALSTLWKWSYFNSFQIRFRDIYILCIAISEILLLRNNQTGLFTLKSFQDWKLNYVLIVLSRRQWLGLTFLRSQLFSLRTEGKEKQHCKQNFLRAGIF